MISVEDNIIGPWEYFISDGLDIDHVDFQHGTRHGATGKYLFFSEDRHELVQIAQHEIKNNGFKVAKIVLDGLQSGVDFVLCLYWKDDSMKRELAERYAWNPKVKYRYWKSDQDTRDGKYSKEYLEKKSVGLSSSPLDGYDHVIDCFELI